MTTQKNCLWCGREFTPAHGNDSYCCPEHQEEAKKDRQKKRRDPIKNFIPIMMKNHEQIERMVALGMLTCTAQQLMAFEVDISLCRFLKSPQYPDNVVLDFGEFILITDSNFLTFKIEQHDTQQSISAE